MKRILHIVPSLELGGTEAFIMNHYRGLNRQEIQFDFLVCSKKDWPYLKEIDRLGGRVFYTARPSILCFPAFLRGMKQALAEGGPYVAIHCHADADNGVPILCGLLCGVKKRIAHLHAMEEVPERLSRKWFHSVKKWIIKAFATDIWACSRAAGISFVGETFFQKKGKVIRNGISLDRFLNVEEGAVSALKAEFRIPENSLVLGNITRFDENKNQLFLVDVFRKLLERHPDALLLLGGTDGGSLRQVQDYVAEKGLLEKVRFIGRRSDVPACLKLIDVYVFPSVFEGLGIALLEAQAAGCLCVASTGVPEDTDMGLGTAFYLELAQGETAWAAFLSEKLAERKLPSQQEIRAAFGKNHFDINESCKELVDYYG